MNFRITCFFLFSFFVSMSVLSAQELNDSTSVKETVTIFCPPSISPEDFEKIHTIEDTLGVLGYAIVNDSMPENRFASCRKFIPSLVEALKCKNSFDYKFERLNTISIQYPPDSTFRVFTWQLYVDVDEYRYYGAIQMNTPDLKLYPLQDRSEDVLAAEFEVLDNKNWYGALYYNIKPFETEAGTKYLLFGYDAYQFFNKRKVVEVLSFKNDQPVFGAPVFVRSEESINHPAEKLRVVQEYYAGSTVKLNFDEVHDVILFDHLEEMYSKNGMQNIPDGTYEGYRLEEGKWVHVEKMFHQILDEAPREQPLFIDNPKRENRKDIFGKTKKNK